MQQNLLLSMPITKQKLFLYSSNMLTACHFNLPEKNITPKHYAGDFPWFYIAVLALAWESLILGFKYLLFKWFVKDLFP